MSSGFWPPDYDEGRRGAIGSSLPLPCRRRIDNLRVSGLPEPLRCILSADSTYAGSERSPDDVHNHGSDELLAAIRSADHNGLFNTPGFADGAGVLLPFDRLHQAGKLRIKRPRHKPMIIAVVEGDEHICPGEHLPR